MAQAWFRFYSADYLLDRKISDLPMEGQGALVRLWCICHRDRNVPDDPIKAARLAGINPKLLKRFWPVIREKFFTIDAESNLSSSDMNRETNAVRSLSQDRSPLAKPKRDKQKGGAASTPLGTESDSGLVRASKKLPVALSPEPTTKVPSKNLKKGKPKGPNTHLAEELQVDFWKAAKLVPPDKFVNPSLAAKAWAGIVDSGVATGPELVGCVRRYAATFPLDRRCYMTQLHAWLDGAGFMAFLDAERRGDPDPTPSGVPYRGPMHKRPLSAEDLAYLEQMP